MDGSSKLSKVLALTLFLAVLVTVSQASSIKEEVRTDDSIKVQPLQVDKAQDSFTVKIETENFPLESNIIMPAGERLSASTYYMPFMPLPDSLVHDYVEDGVSAEEVERHGMEDKWKLLVKAGEARLRLPPEKIELEEGELKFTVSTDETLEGTWDRSSSKDRDHYGTFGQCELIGSNSFNCGLKPRHYEVLGITAPREKDPSPGLNRHWYFVDPEGTGKFEVVRNLFPDGETVEKWKVFAAWKKFSAEELAALAGVSRNSMIEDNLGRSKIDLKPGYIPAEGSLKQRIAETVRKAARENGWNEEKESIIESMKSSTYEDLPKDSEKYVPQGPESIAFNVPGTGNPNKVYNVSEEGYVLSPGTPLPQCYDGKGYSPPPYSDVLTVDPDFSKVEPYPGCPEWFEKTDIPEPDLGLEQVFETVQKQKTLGRNLYLRQVLLPTCKGDDPSYICRRTASTLRVPTGKDRDREGHTPLVKIEKNADEKIPPPGKAEEKILEVPEEPVRVGEKILFRMRGPEPLNYALKLKNGGETVKEFGKGETMVSYSFGSEAEKGEYKAEMHIDKEGVIGGIEEGLKNPLKSKTFTLRPGSEDSSAAEDMLWVSHCNSNGYEIGSLGEDRSAAESCISELLVPNYFQDEVGERPEVAENLCQELYSAGYSEEEKRCEVSIDE